MLEIFYQLIWFSQKSYKIDAIIVLFHSGDTESQRELKPTPGPSTVLQVSLLGPCYALNVCVPPQMLKP